MCWRPAEALQHNAVSLLTDLKGGVDADKHVTHVCDPEMDQQGVLKDRVSTWAIDRKRRIHGMLMSMCSQKLLQASFDAVYGFTPHMLYGIWLLWP